MNSMKLKHENKYMFYWSKFNYYKLREPKFSIYEIISLCFGIVALIFEVIAAIIINNNSKINFSDIPIETFGIILSLMLYGFVISFAGFVISLIDLKNKITNHKMLIPAIISNSIVLVEALAFMIINAI